MFRGCYWIVPPLTGETTDLERAEWTTSLTLSIRRKSLQCPHVFLPGMLLTIIHPLLKISWKNWMNLQNNLYCCGESLCGFQWTFILHCHLLADLVYCIIQNKCALIFLFSFPFLLSFFLEKKIFSLHPDGNQAADKLWQLRWGFAAVCWQGGDGEPNDFNHHQWPSLTFTVCLCDSAPPSVRRLFPPVRFGWLPGNAACLSAINAAFESSTELENAAGSPEAKTLFDVRDVHCGKIQQNWKVLMGWKAVEAPSICLSEGRDWRMRWGGVRANQELAFRLRKLEETFDSLWIGSVAV